MRQQLKGHGGEKESIEGERKITDVKNTREKERQRQRGGGKFVLTILRLLVLHGKVRGVESAKKFPKGPKIEKIQDLPPGLTFSSENQNFK